MPGPSHRRELMKQAEELARRLVARGVKRQQVRSVLDSLTHGQGDWQERLRVGREILRLSTTDWPSERSGSTPKQLRNLRNELEPLLEGQPSESDLVFLLAWTARMVQVGGRGS